MSASYPLPASDDLAGWLNPSLNRKAYAETFREMGRVHIPKLMSEPAAWRLSYALERETPWNITFNEGLAHLEYARVGADEQQKLAMACWSRARSGFQFFYRRHRLSAAGEPYPDSRHYHAKLVSFLIAPYFYDFIREITGMPAIAWINIQATLYKPLDFLTLHDDGLEGDDRLVAYVLNMTPFWRPDWGGALQFYDKDGHIEQGYMPAFNALNLFRVPKNHSVSQIAPFGGNRYSVTGWFHGGAPKRGPA